MKKLIALAALTLASCGQLATDSQPYPSEGPSSRGKVVLVAETPEGCKVYETHNLSFYSGITVCTDAMGKQSVAMGD